MHGITENINKEYKIQADFFKKWSGNTPNIDGLDVYLNKFQNIFVKYYDDNELKLKILMFQ